MEDIIVCDADAEFDCRVGRLGIEHEDSLVSDVVVHTFVQIPSSYGFLILQPYAENWLLKEFG